MKEQGQNDLTHYSVADNRWVRRLAPQWLSTCWQALERVAARLPETRRGPAKAQPAEGELDSRPQQRSLPEERFCKKSQLEADMRRFPDDTSVRDEYFAVLDEISRSYFGSFFAIFPEIATPLLFRGGSSDVWNMRQIFGTREYDMEVSEPAKILDLGAYVGYTAVFLANRFPNAEMISVEPAGPNFDTLVSNTVAYPNIRCLPAAVWHERSELRLADFAYGDWGTYFHTGEEAPIAGASSGRVVPAYTIQDILEMHDWKGVDLIKCTSHNGHVDRLLHPLPPWFDSVTTIVTRPGARGWQPGDLEALEEVLPSHIFERRSNGYVTVFSRKPASYQRADRPLEVVRLWPIPPQRRAFALSGLADQYSFYRFGDLGLQLTPSPPGWPPASFATELVLGGHARFKARLATYDHFGRGVSNSTESSEDAVVFRMSLLNTETGTLVATGERRLAINTVADWEVEFAPASGVHRVTLSVENVDGESESGRPPSEFIDPRFALNVATGS